MDISVRELGNDTARVVAAMQRGEPVVLTVHGRAVANIAPRDSGDVVRTSEEFLADLEELRGLPARLGVQSDSDDFDTGLTTDDMLP